MHDNSDLARDTLRAIAAVAVIAAVLLIFRRA